MAKTKVEVPTLPDGRPIWEAKNESEWWHAHLATERRRSQELREALQWVVAAHGLVARRSVPEGLTTAIEAGHRVLCQHEDETPPEPSDRPSEPGQPRTIDEDDANALDQFFARHCPVHGVYRDGPGFCCPRMGEIER